LVADALNCAHFHSRLRVTKNLSLFKPARVFVSLDHVASFVANADQCVMRAAVEFWLAIGRIFARSRLT